jgi:hypothetical protein
MTGHVQGIFLVSLVTWTCVSCARAEPPGARTQAPTGPRGVGVASSTSNVGVASSPTTSNGKVADNSAAAVQSSPSPGLPIPASNGRAHDAGIAAASIAPQVDAELFDANGQPKPQTEDLPSAEDPGFVERVNQLCSAIVEGRPELAHRAFFPLVAYGQVKAVLDPERDYKIRLLSHFDRDIVDYHRRISTRHSPIRCSGLRLPKVQARWMKPGSEYNRIGYFRALRSQLDLTDADGNTTTLEVTSLISWRGQWYVVHLHGFE